MSTRGLSAFAAVCLAVTCGEGQRVPIPSAEDKPLDVRPEHISRDRRGWLIHDGGAANQGGGMIIDLAKGGIMRRDVNRRVKDGTQLTLAMRVDANGDQSLEIALAGGCGRDPSGGLVVEKFHLQTGFNRIELSNHFEEAYDCFIVELSAAAGPLSLAIDDAVLTWSE